MTDQYESITNQYQGDGCQMHDLAQIERGEIKVRPGSLRKRLRIMLLRNVSYQTKRRLKARAARVTRWLSSLRGHSQTTPAPSPAEATNRRQATPAPSPAEAANHRQAAPAPSPAEAASHSLEAGDLIRVSSITEIQATPVPSPAEAASHSQATPVPSPAEVTNHSQATPVPSPAEVTNHSLKAGDQVRVRSLPEIQATLSLGTVRGCSFMPEMAQYCGTIQRVFKRVNRFLDERDYRVKKVAGGIVLLEGVHCGGTALFGPCDRSCLFFWAEEWLEKID